MQINQELAVLSYPIQFLFNYFLSFPILSYPIHYPIPYPILSCPIPSYPVPFYHILSFSFFLIHSFLPHPLLSHHLLSGLFLSIPLVSLLNPSSQFHFILSPLYRIQIQHQIEPIANRMKQK